MNFESGCGIFSSQTGACGSGNGASFRGGARTHLRHSVRPTKAVDQRRSSPLLEHRVAAATLRLLLVLFIRKDDDDEDEAQPTWTWAPGAPRGSQIGQSHSSSPLGPESRVSILLRHVQGLPASPDEKGPVSTEDGVPVAPVFDVHNERRPAALDP